MVVLKNISPGDIILTSYGAEYLVMSVCKEGVFVNKTHEMVPFHVISVHWKKQP